MNSIVKIDRALSINNLAEKIISSYDPNLLEMTLNSDKQIPLDEIIELVYGVKLIPVNSPVQNHFFGDTIYVDSIIPCYNDETESYDAMFIQKNSIIFREEFSTRGTKFSYNYTISKQFAQWYTHTKIGLNLYDWDFKVESEYLTLSLLMPKALIEPIVTTMQEATTTTLDIINTISQMLEIFPEDVQTHLQNLGMIEEYHDDEEDYQC